MVFASIPGIIPGIPIWGNPELGGSGGPGGRPGLPGGANDCKNWLLESMLLLLLMGVVR
jgi:hypothetical protein